MKRILISLFAGICLSSCALLANYLYYQKNGFLMLAKTVYGGEITIQKGLGLSLVHVYAMMQGQNDSIRLSFDLISFVLVAVLFGLLVYGVWSILAKR